MRIENLQNENRKYAKSLGNFHVLEYVQDTGNALDTLMFVLAIDAEKCSRN